MKLISVDALLSIAKDVILGNGAKHRCIDATQIHELPKIEIALCKDCIYYTNYLCWNVPKNESPRPKEETFFCADGRRKDGEQE